MEINILNNKLDIFYPPKEVIENLCSMLFGVIIRENVNLSNLNLLEPSARSGIFLQSLREQFPFSKIIKGIDTHPNSSRIEKKDFIVDFTPWGGWTSSNSMIVGNPPFSRLKEFCQKAQQLSDRIAFVIPYKYRYGLSTAFLDRDFELALIDKIPRTSFETLEGKKKEMLAYFVYYRRKVGYRRRKLRKNVVKDFDKCPMNYVLDEEDKKHAVCMITWRGSKAGETRDVDFTESNKNVYCLMIRNDELRSRWNFALRKNLESKVKKRAIGGTSKKIIDEHELIGILNELLEAHKSEKRLATHCTICSYRITNRSQYALECGHDFHAACIFHWLKNNIGTCPNC